jgi:hypothetical protein
MASSGEKDGSSPVKKEESVHPLPRHVVELRASRPTRSHARPNERQEILDRGELERAGVITEGVVGRLPGR